MNTFTFNTCLLTGWLMVTGGVAMVSVPLGLSLGGLLLMGVTLQLARWTGVGQPKKG